MKNKELESFTLALGTWSIICPLYLVHPCVQKQSLSNRLPDTNPRDTKMILPGYSPDTPYLLPQSATFTGGILPLSDQVYTINSNKCFLKMPH